MKNSFLFVNIQKSCEKFIAAHISKSFNIINSIPLNKNRIASMKRINEYEKITINDLTDDAIKV